MLNSCAQSAQKQADINRKIISILTWHSIYKLYTKAHRNKFLESPDVPLWKGELHPGHQDWHNTVALENQHSAVTWLITNQSILKIDLHDYRN